MTIAILLTLLSGFSHAQRAPLVTPPDLRPKQQEEPSSTLPQPAPQQIPGAAAEEFFVTVGNVVVKGGFDAFADATEVLVAAYLGKRVAVSDFYKLAAAIEALYQDAGYLLVRVTVPPQSIGNGENLNLQVVDGYIESLDAQGVPVNAQPSVQRALASLIGQRGLKGAVLERALITAGRSPGLRLRSALAPGREAGGVLLILEGTHDLLAASYAVNNRLSNSLGQWDSVVRLALNQPLNLGEQFYVYLAGGPKGTDPLTGDGLRRTYGGGATFNLGSDGLTFNLEYTKSETRPKSRPYTPDLYSQFERYSTRLTWPLLLNRSQELTLTTTLDVMEAIDDFPQFNFTLAHDRLRVMRLSADWRRGLNNGKLNANATFSQGTKGLGARTRDDVAASGIGMSRPGAIPDFQKLDASLAVDYGIFQVLESRTLLRGQLALKGVLPSAELFALDGEQALSTLPAGTLSGDAGWSLRQEMAYPLLMSGSVVIPYAFGSVARQVTRVQFAPSGKHGAWGLGLRGGWQQVSITMEYGSHNVDRINEKRLFVSGGVAF